MSRFVIEGQHTLEGEITVSGMKNAATPIIAATLLTTEECVISNVPRIIDVFKMLDILAGMGAELAWTGEHEVSIRCKDIDPSRLDTKAVKALRSSVLLIGPLLARFRTVAMPQPGGCIIGNRPLDTHFAAMEGIGGTVEEDREQIVIRAEKLQGAHVILSEFSVTATENLMMAAALAPGKTTIDLAAAEPHVQDLAKFLQSMGAHIEGAGTHHVVIEGVRSLSGARHTVIPDQIEAGTFAVAGALTPGELVIRGIEVGHLDSIRVMMRKAGVAYGIENNALRVQKSARLQAFTLQTLPYPGFPTDLQAPFAVLATQATGTSLIHDPMFEGRMGYVQELIKMGANAIVCDPHRVLITGPTPLYGQEIRSFDLRAGATLIIAGLLAQGITTIENAEMVDRGYESIEQRLSAIGAKITRET